MSNLKRLLENLLLTENYYSNPVSVYSVISRWQKAGDKLYDDDQPIMLPTEDIYPFREFDRTREGGRNTPEEWDQIVSWLETAGWDPKKPLHMLIGRDGGAKVGEGNHRIAIARQLGIKTIPVQFHFVWDKVVKDKLPSFNEGMNMPRGNKVWFAGSPSQEIKRLSNSVAKAHTSTRHQLVCKDLAKRLNRAGLDVKIHHGTYGGDAHSWLEVEGSIVDPTANQFDDFPNMDELEYVDHEVETLWENKYPGLSETAPAGKHEKYYHCTPARNLKSIMKIGLIPGTGESFGNYDWSENKLFLSKGYEQAKSWQEILASQTTEEKVAILEVELSPIEIENLYNDDYAQEQDGNEESFYTLDSIPPNKIKVIDDGEGTIDNFLKENGAMAPEDYRIPHRAPGKEDNSPIYDLKGIYPDDFYSLPLSTAARYYGASEPGDVSVVNLIRTVHNKPNAKVKIYRAVSKEKSLAEKISDLTAQKKYILKTGNIPPAKFLSKEQARVARSAKNSSAYYEFLATEQEKLENKLNTTGEPERLNITSFNSGDWVTVWRPYAIEHGEGNLGGEYKILTKTVPAKTLWTNGDSLYEFGYNL